jgi:hypothetical protein
MSSLIEALRASEALLPEPFRSTHARLFVEEAHLANLAARLLAFFRDGAPVQPPPPYFAAEQTPPLADAFAYFRPALVAWHAAPEAPDAPANFAEALTAAGCKHVLILLGMRLTPASVTGPDALPPPRARLLAAAERQHGANDLTVAARALSKHVHRSPGAFWGEVRGPVAQQNVAARLVIDQLLDHATWWNVFGHFAHELVYEVRVPSGHGARWGRLGDTFIGFLEPFDEQRCPSLTHTLKENEPRE